MPVHNSSFGRCCSLLIMEPLPRKGLNGGHQLWAFEAMTGDNVMRFDLEDGKWFKYKMLHFGDENQRRKIGLRRSMSLKALWQYHDDYAEFQPEMM